MLLITAKLKEGLAARGIVDASDDEATIRRKMSAAISSGKLEINVLSELATIESFVTPALEKWLIDNGHAERNKSDSYYQTQTIAAVRSGAMSKTTLRELVGDYHITGKKAMTLSPTAPTVSDLTNAAGAGSGGAGGGVRIRKASERYSSKSMPVISKLTGQPLVVFGSPVETPSEASFARIGAWFKHYLRSNGEVCRRWDMRIPEMTEHEKQLLEEVYHEGHFCGVINNSKHIDRAMISDIGGLSVKALLDDATSGGQALVPYELDTSIVRLPYLHSQIFPLVDLRTASSSEVKTGKMGQVTVSWGTAEGTAISLFDTDALITEPQIPILACTAAVEVGKDFLADSPVADFGAMLVDEFGQAMLSEFDRVICEGNGTTEPEGFTVAAGTISVNSDNAGPGPWTLGDFIETLFSVPLQYREQGLNGVFVSNDTTFMRSRQIKVDTASPSTDQRPVMSTVDEVSRYTSAGYPHRISNSGMSNRALAFICLRKYRFYRRTGIEMMMVDQDWTLARQNKRGFVIRSRVGGKLIDTNACALIEDGQS